MSPQNKSYKYQQIILRKTQHFQFFTQIFCLTGKLRNMARERAGDYFSLRGVGKEGSQNGERERG